MYLHRQARYVKHKFLKPERDIKSIEKKNKLRNNETNLELHIWELCRPHIVMWVSRRH